MCIRDSIQTGKKILPRVMKSNVPFETKVQAWCHLTANISYPLMIVLSVLLMPAMIIRSWQGYIQMLLIDLPLDVYKRQVKDWVWGNSPTWTTPRFGWSVVKG